MSIVHDVTNVEQRELLGIDAGCPLSNVTPKRTDSLAVVEGVQSHFFWATATARAIGHVYQTRFDRSKPFHASRQVSENSELFKKP